MPSAMPPLNGLRAFEATARHLSMTEAAKELNVTPGALSHQVRALEELLGLKLFERGVRTLSLTPEGQHIYPGLRNSFSQIQETIASLRNFSADNVLVVSSTHGFTAKWLASRLYRFSVEHPEIDARVSSSFSIANFASDDVDVAVRILSPEQSTQEGLIIERLIAFDYIPVCSPLLLEQYGPVSSAKDLAKLPLIHDESADDTEKMSFWRTWFREMGVKPGKLTRGIRFNSADPAINAAVEGAGVLLASNILAYDDLRTGRLISPVYRGIPSNRGFYLVYPVSSWDRASVRAFHDWIVKEFDELDGGILHGASAT